MNCRILKSIFVKANGEIVCDDDAGQGISLGWVETSYKWSIDNVFNNEKYQQIRKALKNGYPPWGNLCTKCALFNSGELFDDNLNNKQIRIQVEPSLKCTLACPCCSRTHQIKQRPSPYLMNLKVFESLLKSCSESGFKVTEIEFAGNGEPLSHPEFSGFIELSRSIMPKSKLTLCTNGNYNYQSSLKNHYMDEITVSCDGLYQTSYEMYRRNGSVSKALHFMKDAKFSNQPRQPFVTWKYILFEFNDSDEELVSAQEKAMELCVDRILFVITITQYKSQRFNVRNIQKIPLISKIAYVNTVPNLTRIKQVGKLLSSHYRSSPLSFISKPRKILCTIDQIYISDTQLLVIAGWAMEENGQRIKAISVYCNNKFIGNAQVGLSRPDVLYVYPLLKNDKSGFLFIKSLFNSYNSSDKITLKFTTAKGLAKKKFIDYSYIWIKE